MPGWTLREDVRLNSYRACREMLNHLATPAKQAALNELDNIGLARQAYEQLGMSTISMGEVLRRFRHLNADYRELSNIHDNCQGLAARAETAEGERDAQAARYEELATEHEAMGQRYKACALRYKDLMEKSNGFDQERDLWLKKMKSKPAVSINWKLSWRHPDSRPDRWPRIRLI